MLGCRSPMSVLLASGRYIIVIVIEGRVAFLVSGFLPVFEIYRYPRFWGIKLTPEKNQKWYPRPIPYQSPHEIKLSFSHIAGS